MLSARRLACASPASSRDVRSASSVASRSRSHRAAQVEERVVGPHDQPVDRHPGDEIHGDQPPQVAVESGERERRQPPPASPSARARSRTASWPAPGRRPRRQRRRGCAPAATAASAPAPAGKRSATLSAAGTSGTSTYHWGNVTRQNVREPRRALVGSHEIPQRGIDQPQQRRDGEQRNPHAPRAQPDELGGRVARGPLGREGGEGELGCGHGGVPVGRSAAGERWKDSRIAGG